MKGKKNLLILFSCVLTVIIAAHAAQKKLFRHRNMLLMSMLIQVESYLNLLPYESN